MLVVFRRIGNGAEAGRARIGAGWDMASGLNLPTWVREPYEHILARGARLLARTGTTPNALTAFSLLPAILAGIAVAAGWFATAALMLVLSGICDILDGALARQTGRTSRFGALLDSSLDRLSDAAVPLGLIVIYAPHGLAVLVPGLAMLSGYTISYVRARAEGLGFALPRLWMRREDRMAVVVVALLLAPVGLPGILLPAPITLLLFTALALFGFVAALQALLAARKLE